MQRVGQLITKWLSKKACKVPTNKILLVFAGNQEQYYRWLGRIRFEDANGYIFGYTHNQVHYISGIHSIMGYANCHYIKIGTWYSHDIWNNHGEEIRAVAHLHNITELPPREASRRHTHKVMGIVIT